MSPYAKMATTIWSNCSRKFVSELFEYYTFRINYYLIFIYFIFKNRNHLGDCLLDEPVETAYKNINMLPGSVYDADYQCNLIFENSTKCKNSNEKICEVFRKLII